MNKKVIILIGPPGSGKGTQANLLAEKFDFYHLEMSKTLEESFKNKKNKKIVRINGKNYSFKKEKQLWEQGKLCSPAFVIYLIKDRVKILFEEKKGIIFSGNPRTLEETQEILPFLEKLYGKLNVKIFVLGLTIKESVWRNSHRRICELMRHPMVYNNETKKLSLCPLDGSKLIVRTLDKPEIIKKRYQIYEQETLPLVSYAKNQKFKVININADQSIANVFDNILKKLKS